MPSLDPSPEVGSLVAHEIAVKKIKITENIKLPFTSISS